MTGAALVLGAWHVACGGPAAAQQAPRAGQVALAASAQSWSRSEIEVARARCQILLNRLDVVVIEAHSIREGDCGAPAPVQLVSIGSNPQVALFPPPTVTCELAAGLARWLEDEVQPAARALLGGPVIRLEVMSDYSCRTAYARIKAKLSEHGRANAVDISRFVTDSGQIAEVRADWGATDRDARSQIAAADAAGKSEEGMAKDEVAPAALAASESAQGSTGMTGAATNSGDMTPGSVRALSATTAPTLSFGPGSRLGGPRTEPPAQVSRRQRFLRRIHSAACRSFGTVLGPEANEAHRNHFHLDMAERTTGSFCE